VVGWNNGSDGNIMDAGPEAQKHSGGHRSRINGKSMMGHCSH